MHSEATDRQISDLSPSPPYDAFSAFSGRPGIAALLLPVGAVRSFGAYIPQAAWLDPFVRPTVRPLENLRRLFFPILRRHERAAADLRRQNRSDRAAELG